MQSDESIGIENEILGISRRKIPQWVFQRKGSKDEWANSIKKE
jgi:hypothetical protein